MEKTNLIYGKMETGKTKILIEETEKLINNNENILFLDLKEEYYKKYLEKLKEKKYNIVVINLKNPLQSDNFNPFSLPYQYYKKNEIDKAIELINMINNRIFKEESIEYVDPFWTQASSSLFSSLTLLTFKEANEDEINLGSISLGLDLVNKYTLLKKYYDDLSPIDPIYILGSTSIYSPTDTRGSIVSISKNKMRNYILKPNLLQLLGSTNFSFDKDKTAVFIIPKENDKEVNNIANILIDQLVYLTKQKNLNYNLILDNIDFINKLDSLEELINLAYKNIKLYIATRDLEKLTKIYTKEVIDNILNVIGLEIRISYDLNIDNTTVTYPNLNQDVKYFNIEKFLKEKYNE